MGYHRSKLILPFFFKAAMTSVKGCVLKSDGVILESASHLNVGRV